MRHRHQHEPEWPFLDPLQLHHGPKVHLDAELLDPPPGHLQGKLGAIDGDLYLPEEVGERSYVILMGVGDHHAPDVLTTVRQPAPVGEDEVNTEHVLLGEHQTAVDQGDLATDFDGGAVAPDLAETTEKGDPNPLQLSWRTPGWGVGPGSVHTSPLALTATAFTVSALIGLAPYPTPP